MVTVVVVIVVIVVMCLDLVLVARRARGSARRWMVLVSRVLQTATTATFVLSFLALLVGAIWEIAHSR